MRRPSPQWCQWLWFNKYSILTRVLIPYLWHLATLIMLYLGLLRLAKGQVLAHHFLIGGTAMALIGRLTMIRYVIRVAFHSLNLLINYDGRDPGVIPVYYQPPFSLPPDDLWDKIAHRKSLPLSALAKDLNTDLRRGLSDPAALVRSTWPYPAYDYLLPPTPLLLWVYGLAAVVVISTLFITNAHTLGHDLSSLALALSQGRFLSCLKQDISYPTRLLVLVVIVLDILFSLSFIVRRARGKWWAALVLRQGKAVTIPWRKVVEGDVVLLKPGMKGPKGTVLRVVEDGYDHYVLSDPTRPPGEAEDIPLAAYYRKRHCLGRRGVNGDYSLLFPGHARFVVISQEPQPLTDGPAQSDIQRVLEERTTMLVGVAALVTIFWCAAFWEPTNIPSSLVDLLVPLLACLPFALSVLPVHVLGVDDPHHRVYFKNDAAVESTWRATTVVLDLEGGITQTRGSKLHSLRVGKPKISAEPLHRRAEDEAMLALLVAAVITTDPASVTSSMDLDVVKEAVGELCWRYVEQRARPLKLIPSLRYGSQGSRVGSSVGGDEEGEEVEDECGPWIMCSPRLRVQCCRVKASTPSSVILRAYLRGPYSLVMDRCDFIMDEATGLPVSISNEVRAELEGLVEDLAQQEGLRVVTLAMVEMNEDTYLPLDKGATFLGFLAFSDTLDQHDNLAPLEDLTSFYGTRETREGGVVKTRSPIRLLSESYDKDSAFILATEAGLLNPQVDVVPNASDRERVVEGVVHEYGEATLLCLVGQFPPSRRAMAGGGRLVALCGDGACDDVRHIASVVVMKDPKKLERDTSTGLTTHGIWYTVLESCRRIANLRTSLTLYVSSKIALLFSCLVLPSLLHFLSGPPPSTPESITISQYSLLSPLGTSHILLAGLVTTVACALAFSTTPITPEAARQAHKKSIWPRPVAIPALTLCLILSLSVPNLLSFQPYYHQVDLALLSFLWTQCLLGFYLSLPGVGGYIPMALTTRMVLWASTLLSASFILAIWPRHGVAPATWAPVALVLLGALVLATITYLLIEVVPLMSPDSNHGNSPRGGKDGTMSLQQQHQQGYGSLPIATGRSLGHSGGMKTEDRPLIPRSTPVPMS